MGDLLPGPGGALGHHATLPSGWGGHHLSPGPVGGVALPLRHALAPQVEPGFGSRSRIPLPPPGGPSPLPGDPITLAHDLVGELLSTARPSPLEAAGGARPWFPTRGGPAFTCALRDKSFS